MQVGSVPDIRFYGVFLFLGFSWFFFFFFFFLAIARVQEIDLAKFVFAICERLFAFGLAFLSIESPWRCRRQPRFRFWSISCFISQKKKKNYFCIVFVVKKTHLGRAVAVRLTPK